MLEIRVLNPDDWRLWRRLRLDALADAPYAFTARLAEWQGKNDVEERWRGRLGIAGSLNVVAELDGEPVGMASAVPTADDGVIEVISMWVAPAARGRGAGDALMRELERWAETARAHTLRLCVSEGNPAAVALYRRHGLRHTGELGEVMPDGAARERVMAKRLPAER